MASKLYVDQAPAAFANWAAKYNNLVYLIRTMQGNGCDIKVSDSQIIISVSASTSGGIPDPLDVTTLNATFASISYLSAGVVTFDTLYSVTLEADYFQSYDSATFVDAFAISATINRLDSTTFLVDSINCTDAATFVDLYGTTITANYLDATTFSVDAINCTDSATFVDAFAISLTANFLESTSFTTEYIDCTNSATFVDAYSISLTANFLEATSFSVEAIDCTDSATFVDLYGTTITANYLFATTFSVDAINCTDSATFVDAYSTTITANYLDIEGTFKVVNGSYSLSVPFASVTRNMTIKEIDVCSGGVAKKMLILASDPY